MGLISIPMSYEHKFAFGLKVKDLLNIFLIRFIGTILSARGGVAICFQVLILLCALTRNNGSSKVYNITHYPPPLVNPALICIFFVKLPM